MSEDNEDATNKEMRLYAEKAKKGGAYAKQNVNRPIIQNVNVTSIRIPNRELIWLTFKVLTIAFFWTGLLVLFLSLFWFLLTVILPLSLGEVGGTMVVACLTLIISLLLYSWLY